MLRLAVLGVALLGLVVGGIIAGEYKGKIKSIDTDAKKVTLETKDGDKTFKYTGESKIVGGKGDMTFDKGRSRRSRCDCHHQWRRRQRNDHRSQNGRKSQEERFQLTKPWAP